MSKEGSYRRKSPEYYSDLAAIRRQKELDRELAGSFDRSQDFSFVGFDNTKTGTNYDMVSRSRVTAHGDFVHTTPYSVSCFSRKGSSFIGAIANVKRATGGGYSLRVARSGSNPAAQPFGSYSEDLPLRNRLDSSSQLALLTKVRKEQPSWDILTDAAELKESVGLLRKSATTISSLLLAVERRDVRSIAKTLGLKTRPQHLRKYHRDIYGVEWYEALDRRTPFLVGDGMQNLWMTYRYGFMPMIYSIEDAMIALAGPARNREYVFTSQVTLRDSWSRVSVDHDVPFYNFGSATCDITTTLRTDGSVRKKAYYRFTDGIRQRLLPNVLIGFTKTAWELVPYSWMADWALGISTYLSDMELPDLLAEVYVNVTHKGNSYVAESLGNFQMNLNPGDEGNLSIIFAPGAGVHTSTFFTMSRKSGNIAIPEYSLKEVFFNWKKQLDSASILWQKNRNHVSVRCRVHPSRFL